MHVLGIFVISTLTLFFERWRAIGIAFTLTIFAAASVAQPAPRFTFTVDGFEVSGENPLSESATQKVLAPFTGEYDGLDGINAAKDALESEFRKRGYTFHRAVLPPQDLDAGTVTLNVVTFALGEARVEGGERYDQGRVQSILPGLASGLAPNMQRISRELAVANIHPGRYFNLNFARNPDTPDTLDANVGVNEKRPYSFFSGFNNIGTDQTGNLRLTLGAQYNDLWRRDHIATATFSTAPDNADDVQQYAFNYRAPIYRWNAWVTGFYIRSDVDIGNVQQFFDVSGSGDFAGLSIRHWLMPIGRYRHSLSFGIQDRRFDTGIANATTGAAIPGISTVVRSRPITLTYQSDYRWSQSQATFNVDFVQNLGFGGHNRDQNYSRVRTGSESEWNAIRFAMAYSHNLPKGWMAVGKVAGQYADEPLIPGEQFGLGGERTVRGFEERAIAGDDAVLFNFEIWTPPIRSWFGMRFFAFSDVGFKHLEEPQNPQITSDTISSAGIGFRVDVNEYLFVSADYGHVVSHARGETSDKGNVKTHFNVVLRY